MIEMVVDKNDTRLEEVPEKVKAPKKESVRPGKKIRNMFTRLVKDNMLDEATVMNLTTSEFTKSTFKIKYPFLKELVSDDVRAEAKINGRPRYSTKPMEILGKKYLITNDLYEKNLEPMKTWYKATKG